MPENEDEPAYVIEAQTLGCPHIGAGSECFHPDHNFYPTWSVPSLASFGHVTSSYCTVNSGLSNGMNTFV